ncbi:MAG: hypothetical protein KTR21_02160 [Rhodobacteraceae bacterium]|nr:hypothetical protein [Paracoccaceae bacterium]
MRALLAFAAAALIATSAGAAGKPHCALPAPAKATAADQEKQKEIIGEVQSVIEPILGSLALCGKLDSVEPAFLSEFLTRHDCPADSDVGVAMANRLDPASRQNPPEVDGYFERFPREMERFCATVGSLSLPSQALLDDSEALEAWNSRIGALMGQAGRILTALTGRRGAQPDAKSTGETDG